MLTKEKFFSILIGGLKGHGTNKVCGMVVMPLGFRTIGVRLVACAYGGLYHKHLQ
jgi:hypothetical protein